MLTLLASSGESFLVLDKIWIIPALMVAAFVLTLFFGKSMRLPLKGAEFGLIAVVLALVLSTFSVLEWRNHVAEHDRRVESAVAAAPATGTAAEAEAAIPVEGAASAEVGLKAEGAASEGEGVAEPVRKIATWYRDGDTKITVGFHVDGFTVFMLFLVAFVSLCVHVYSLEYLKGDKRFTHYFAAVELFTGAMFWMVTSSSTVQLLFGWEVMGLCSFMLIGHWWEEHENSTAALKAFLTTRTGDIGLLIGIVMLFFLSGQSFDMRETNRLALSGAMNATTLTVAAVALFFGVMGKSAQFPLHTWLPDAMAGPTPASSLIHAATMVVAGVYVMARLFGVFFMGFHISAGGVNLGALIGAITLVMAAGLAFVQDDIKKVLAYSTVSQLGYMVMALGVGAWTGSIFHLFTHAFFKALLFQAAGSIAHSGSHHSFDMKKSMGGLRKYMPITFWTFMMGYLALAGVIPFSGFFSKDEILLGASKNGFFWMWLAGSIGAFMTAAYMTRALYLTFFGENRLMAAHGAHEAHADAHDNHALQAAHGVQAAHAVDLGHVAHAAHDVHGAHAAHDVHGAHDVHDVHGAHAAPVAHDDHGHGGDPHESNWLITGPLIALAVMSVIAGFVNIPQNHYWFAHLTETDYIEKIRSIKEIEHHFSWSVAIPSLLFAGAGIATGWVYMTQFKGDLGLVRRGGVFGLAHRTLKKKYYLDHLWTGVVVGGVKGPLAKVAYWFNQFVIDDFGVNKPAKFVSKSLAKAVYIVDQRAVDGVANSLGTGAGLGGGVLRTVQNGKVQSYAALFLGSVALITLGLLLFI